MTNATTIRRGFLWGVAVALSLGVAVAGRGLPQQPSPPGESATEIGGRFDDRESYVGGAWVRIRYGRPIKRGRNLFGVPDFAEALNDGAPVWRAGANVSTLLINEVPLVLGGKVVPAGEHTLFIDLKPGTWTLIVSEWPAQKTTYDVLDKTALWGAYDYTPDRDVVRVPMDLEPQGHSFDQLSWEFLDVSGLRGRIALIWDRQMASVPFEVLR